MIIHQEILFINFLNNKNFINDGNLKLHLGELFAKKDREFYERGSMKLPER